MQLNREEIKHIADLARLEFTKEELKKYGEQLSGILNFIDQLKEVDVKGIEPTAQVTELINVFRDDIVRDWDETERLAAIKQAPSLEDGQVKVKRVIE